VPDNLIPAEILMPEMVRSDLDSSGLAISAALWFIFDFLDSVLLQILKMNR
jgi:hypothetical protein